MNRFWDLVDRTYRWPAPIYLASRFVFWVTMLAIWDTAMIVSFAAGDKGCFFANILGLFLLMLPAPITLYLDRDDSLSGPDSEGAAFALFALYVVAGFISVLLLNWVYPHIPWLAWVVQ